MEYINNIYDYQKAKIIAQPEQKTHRAIIAQGTVNQTIQLDVKAMENSSLELHICNIIDNEDTIKYDIDVTAEENSNVTLSVVSIKGKNVDVNINVNIIGKNAGLLLPSKNQSFTYHSNVIHQSGGSTTIQKVRSVADDNGYGDFFGIIKVDPNAQKSVTEQVNNNILLSTDARIESKPQLEIYADDVKCSHGSTTGMLDQEAIFYMRSRGISQKTAQNLLLEAFINEVIENLTQDNVYKDFVKDIISEKLGME